MQPSPRQTLSYLRTLFEQRGIAPKNKLGQNFLIDLNLLDLVVRTAELTAEDLAVEVGSGTGSLTMRLVESAGAVVSVELDPPFAAMTRDLVESHFALFATGREAAGARRENVRLIHGDALANKNTLSPELVGGIRELMAQAGTKRVKLVANLPYAVAVPVLSNLLLTDLPVERMVAMVQWEIAERLAATPGMKGYAALAVMTQSLADVTVVRRVPPSVFFPRPQVDSAIVLVRPSPEKRAHVGDPVRLRNFLRDLYTHRRKNLRGALAGLPSGRQAKGEVDEKLAALGLDGKARAETLDLEQHLRLCGAFG